MLMFFFCNGAMAQEEIKEQPYAEYTYADNTLTFYYGVKPEPSDQSVAFDIVTGVEYDTWCKFAHLVRSVRFDQSFASVRLTSLNNLFAYFIRLESIDFLNLNTSKVTGMHAMFRYCKKLRTLNLKNFDTSNVVDMSEMFRWCGALESVNVSDFNTSNVINMSRMFDGCVALKTLNVSSFNTSKVTDMSEMFQDCEVLEGLDVSHFRTSNVVNMSGMFKGCDALQELNVSNFNTGNVTDMSRMFCGCYGLKTLDVTKFNTDKVTDMSQMFGFCVNLQTLDVTKFNTVNVTDMGGMFSGCRSLQTLDVTKFNTDKVTDMKYMFSGCVGLQTLDVTKFNTDKVTDMSQMFGFCVNLQTLDVTKFSTANVTDMSQMFCNCSNLDTLDVSNFNTGEVTSMGGMFDGCVGLQTLYVSNFNTDKVEYMTGMFSDCSGLRTLDVTNFNTDSVVWMGGMFYGCSGLNTLDLSSFNTENVCSMSEMFSGCTGLKTIYVGDGFKTTSVENSTDMFCGNDSLVGAVRFSADNANDATFANYKNGYFCFYYLIGGRKYPVVGDPLAVDSLYLEDGKDFAAPREFTVARAYYSRPVNQKWGTLCLPYAFDASNNPTAYFYQIEKISDDQLCLKRIEGIVEAGVPVIVCAKNNLEKIEVRAANVCVIPEPQNSIEKDYNLVGLFVTGVVPDSSYVIADDSCFVLSADLKEQSVKRRKTNNGQGVYARAFHAYLMPNGLSATPNRLTIDFDNPSSIADVFNDVEKGISECYDITGRRLNAPQKGVNIIRKGGKAKKIIVR